LELDAGMGVQAFQLYSDQNVLIIKAMLSVYDFFGCLTTTEMSIQVVFEWHFAVLFLTLVTSTGRLSFA